MRIPSRMRLLPARKIGLSLNVTPRMRSMVKVGSSANPERDGSTRLIQRAETCKGGGQVEMCDGIISVGLQAPAQPHDRFGLGVEQQLGNADIVHPPGEELARPSFILAASAGWAWTTKRSSTRSRHRWAAGRARLRDAGHPIAEHPSSHDHGR